MLVENCDLYVSYYLWDEEKRFRVFCYPVGRDTFETVGSFETEAEAEALKQRMITGGGSVYNYMSKKDLMPWMH